MKREVPILLYLVGIALLLGFIYAAFVVGMDLTSTVAVNRGVAASLVASAVRFVVDNKEIFSVAVLVIVVVKLFMRTPRQARS